MDVYQRRRLVALSALAVVFIAVVLLIKSCGGDDDETPVTPLGASGAAGTSTITQDEYISQGDAICLDSNTALANVDQSDPTQAAKDEADVVTGELQQLQSLPQPDDGTTKLGNFLNALEKQAAAYQDRATAVERGDDATATDLESTIQKAGDDAANSAENFGFKACGNPDKTGSTSTTGGSDDTSSNGSGGSVATTTPTDTGGTVTPTTTTPIPTTPTTTVPAAPVPTTPTDTGGGATPTPPADTGGGTDTGGTESGGVSP
jgi:cell division septation protein DedD